MRPSNRPLLTIMLGAILVLLAGCAMPMEPTFKGISQFQRNGNEHGGEPGFAVGLDFYNPNAYKLKIIAYDLNVSVNNAKVGNARHRGKQVMQPKGQSTVSFHITSDANQLLNGLIGALGGLLGQKKSITVGVQGIITAKALGFKKRFRLALEKEYSL